MVKVYEPGEQSETISPGKTYRIETSDGRKYRTDRLSATDSTLVLTSLEVTNEREFLGRSHLKVIEPFEIALEDVRLVVREELDEDRTVGLVVLCVLGAIALGGIMMGLMALDSGSSW